MQEISTQLHDSCPACKYRFLHLIPFDDSSLEELKGLKIFQVLKTRLWGIAKPRSMKQLAAYWVACEKISQIISDESTQYNKKRVDFMVKVEVSKVAPELIKYFYSKNGTLYMETISISFKNMKHLIACRFFDNAFLILADMGGITLEKLKQLVGMDDL